jgi:hypothetical protein
MTLATIITAMTNATVSIVMMRFISGATTATKSGVLTLNWRSRVYWQGIDAA